MSSYTKVRSLRGSGNELSLLTAAIALCLMFPATNAKPWSRPSAFGRAASVPARPYSAAHRSIQNSQQPDKPAKPAFSLHITEEQVIGISLRAKNARLSEIAAELSSKLKAPVALSRVMEKERTTVTFSDLLLEPAMQLLAPVVYIDYEIDSALGAQPVGIYLHAYNEPAPAANAVVRGKSQAFVVEGNTEEDGEGSEEEVQVSYRAGNLTVKAKEKPLVEVLSRIASEVGIPLEANDDSTETVSVNIQDLPLDAAILRLSPHLRFYVRADLSRGQKTPLRIVLVEQDKKVVE